MQTVTRYRASDDREFSDPDDCDAYERRCEKLQQITGRLRPVPDTTEFGNGGGCVQQDRDAVLSAQRDIALLVEEAMGPWVSQYTQAVISAVEPAGGQFLGRIICDANDRAVSRAWGRIMCIDDRFREWGQPYFARNPEQGRA